MSVLDLLNQLQSSAEDDDSCSSEDERFYIKGRHLPLWINASDVSGITGYNPYCDHVQMLTDYLYKGRDDLTEKDEEDGVQVISEGEFIMSCLEKTRDHKKVSQLLECKPDTHTELQDLNNKIDEEVKNACSVLTSEEKQVIEKVVNKEDLKEDDISTLKSLCEDQSLAAEEKQVISCILANPKKKDFKNIDLKKVQALTDKTTMTSDEQQLLAKKLRGNVNKSFGTMKEHIAIKIYEQRTGHRVRNNNDRLYKLKFVKDECDPYFWICGKVDGITDKRGSPDRCLLEVKNRKNRLFKNIPIYDQVQTTIYMKMLGCEFCDFVQCLNTSRGPKISINEITINHQLWSVVQDRLYKYIDLIYRLRDDHDLRQSVLRQDRESILEFLNSECEWIYAQTT